MRFEDLWITIKRLLRLLLGPFELVGLDLDLGMTASGDRRVSSAALLICRLGAAPGVGVLVAGVGDEGSFCFPDLDGDRWCGQVQGSVDG